MKKRAFLIIAMPFMLAAAALSQTAESRNVRRLSASVEVRRDSRSIPYIAAKNDADLYFAQGYITASDRLFQMDLMRRLARGRMSEIFGDRTLDEDKRWRRFGFASIAELNFAKLKPDVRKALEDYARGVNAYIDAAGDQLPPEFKILQYKPERWLPSDSIVIGKILADALSSTWRHDLLRASLSTLPKEKFADLIDQVTPSDVILFGTDVAPAKSVSNTDVIVPSAESLASAAFEDEIRARSLVRIGLHAEDLAASNNWVVSGKKTADGWPLLANDPHLAPTAPGIWYLTHLSTPDLRVAGVTFPGVPGIVLGHNADIAWGATNVGPDVQDLYKETFNDKGETSAGRNKWAPAFKRTEKIFVRTDPLKTETRPVDLEVTVTRNGPVIIDDASGKYALKWTALDPANSEFEAFFQLNRARNWDDFKQALSTYGGSTQNFVYADVGGHIGWYAAGKIPIRRTGDGALPYDGSTRDGDWIGFIPFDKLPNLYDPPSGLIVTANQRIVGTSYPFTQISRDAAPPWRARRIYDLLKDRTKLTMDDMRDIQHDDLNLPLLQLAAEISKRTAASSETLADLQGWDGRMRPESRAALLANEIRGCAAGKIADANPGVPVNVIRERVLGKAITTEAAHWLPSQFKSYSDLLKACDALTRASLSDPKRLGPDTSKWTWGIVWRSSFMHPLAGVPFIGAQFKAPDVGLNGSGQTPNVGSYVSMRLIANPGRWDATRHVIPLGQSGDPRSPHFKDQFELWRTGEPAVFPFNEAFIKPAVASTLTLAP